MHCERPFVFNDELRYFAHKKVESLPCDICEETNYFIKDKSKPFLLLISIIVGVISLVPLMGAVWFVYDFLSSTERIRLYVIIGILGAGFIMTTTALNIVYKHYIWQTHKLSKRFESPFLDSLNKRN